MLEEETEVACGGAWATGGGGACLRGGDFATGALEEDEAEERVRVSLVRS